MPVGPSKYDAECVAALVATEATVAVLAVIGGNKGSGFAVNIDAAKIQPGKLEEFHKVFIPKLLREIADQIEGIS